MQWTLLEPCELPLPYIARRRAIPHAGNRRKLAQSHLLIIRAHLRPPPPAKASVFTAIGKIVEVSGILFTGRFL